MAKLGDPNPAPQFFSQAIKHFQASRHIKGMRHVFFTSARLRAFLIALAIAASGQHGSAFAQNNPPRDPLFAWNLLWTGSWEESRTLHNRGDFRLGFARRQWTLRAQALDRRPLNLEADDTWEDFSERSAGGYSIGLYHRATGSRLLYGILHEQGLPARIRSPWSRSAPFAENRRPITADLRTTSSTTRHEEAYLHLASPHLALFRTGISLRGFASAQFALEGNGGPAFSGGLEASIRASAIRLEGFFAGAELPARESSTWFSDPPSLPDREFRICAAALTITAPYFRFASDLAWSRTFAYGSGIYANAAIRISPPLSGTARLGPWFLSLSAEGVEGRYVDRNGASIGSGFRTAGRLERRGPRASLFRADVSLRAPALDAQFDRGSAGVSYRFPAPSFHANAAACFPLRINRISLDAQRNASNLGRIQDSFEAALGLSLALPPMSLPQALLLASSGRARAQNQRARVYPLGISFSSTIQWLGAAGEAPPPFPFFTPAGEFASARIGCELLWSPGIFQFRTRWNYTAHFDRDGKLDGSISASIRFRHGRLTARVAWPDFPEKRNYTLSWRLER